MKAVSTDSGVFRLEACAHPVMPVERLVNIDTGMEKLKIGFKRGKKWRYFIAEKSTLASQTTIVKYADFGLSVSSENSKYLIKYLQDVEKFKSRRYPRSKIS